MQINHEDWKEDSKELLTELVLYGDAMCFHSVAPGQFEQLGKVVEALRCTGELSRVERLTVEQANQIATLMVQDVIPEVEDEITLVGDEAKAGMLLFRRASDGMVMLVINNRHFTSGVFSFRRFTAEERASVRRGLELATVAAALMSLDLDYTERVTSGVDVRSVVEGFLGKPISLAAGQLPLKSDTLRKILGQYGPENSKEHRTNCELLRAAKKDGEAAVAAITAKLGKEAVEAARGTVDALTNANVNKGSAMTVMLTIKAKTGNWVEKNISGNGSLVMCYADMKVLLGHGGCALEAALAVERTIGDSGVPSRAALNTTVCTFRGELYDATIQGTTTKRWRASTNTTCRRNDCKSPEFAEFVKGYDLAVEQTYGRRTLPKRKATG